MRVSQPAANFPHFGAVALSDLNPDSLFSMNACAAGGPAQAPRSQAVAVSSAPSNAETTANAQASAAVPRTAFTPASRVTSRQRLGSAGRKAGRSSGSRIGKVTRRQILLECAMRKGLDPNATWLQDPGTVT